MEVLEMVLASGRRPKSFHSDQDCPFTPADIVGRLTAKDIKISFWQKEAPRKHPSGRALANG
jgi:hypothetical protein